MDQLQSYLPPKPLRSDGMDFDDARSEISHPGSHPDSESSASSFRGNRGAPLHATLIGSSRPCQSPKIRPRVGGNHQAEIDSLLAQIVEEQQNETPGAWHLVYLSWTDIARRLNECGYVRENNLSKTPKYCRDRCDTPYLVTRPEAGAVALLRLQAPLHRRRCTIQRCTIKRCFRFRRLFIFV